MGRLDYSTPTPGKGEPEEGTGGLLSLLSQVSRQRRWIKLKLHWYLQAQRVCQPDWGNGLAAKLYVLALLKKRELLNNCLAMSLSIKMFNVFLKPLIMDLWQKIKAGGQERFKPPLAFKDLWGLNRHILFSTLTNMKMSVFSSHPWEKDSVNHSRQKVSVGS